MHPLILFAGYLAVAVMPLLLGALQDLPPRPLRDEIASGLGMSAFAILLVEFVLSGRFRTISARIGMDVTMRFHQLVARAALAFVILHPFLYSLSPMGTPLPFDPTRQFTLGLDADSLLTGVLAWVALPCFVLMSIFRDQLPYRYEAWRAMHALGALAIAAAVTHHTLAAGRYSADPLLAGFWLLLLAGALASLLWTYLLSPLREARHPYEVASVRKIALKTWELTLRPKQGDALPFAAGQFVWLKLGPGPFTLAENPFSIASAPAERPEIRFVIKEVGDFTRRLGDVAPGSTAYLGRAHGNLTLKGRAAKGVALIAGGVGIAPLLSIARQMQAGGDTRPLTLLYGNRSAGQIVYAEELEALARRDGTKVVHVLSEPDAGWTGRTGLIDAELIGEVFDTEDAQDWLYVLCGPPAMLEGVEQALLARGVPPENILAEQFYYD
ncbi:ferric reductase-like transmembrane domain-containing protein [Nisaea sp.]|uniref:ferredoxin reductase family protein n=1 Tax=Nisaea sp. TaxID=2024842 RepID=UPI003B51580E